MACADMYRGDGRSAICNRVRPGPQTHPDVRAAVGDGPRSDPGQACPTGPGADDGASTQRWGQSSQVVFLASWPGLRIPRGWCSSGTRLWRPTPTPAPQSTVWAAVMSGTSPGVPQRCVERPLDRRESLRRANVHPLRPGLRAWLARDRPAGHQDGQDLKLVEATSFDNGVALLRYEIKK